MYLNRYSNNTNLNSERIDLHLHTTASDGAYSPSDIVSLAQKKGIAVLAITDHDSIEGLDEGARECKKCNINFIPGIELSTSYKKQEIHILGYHINKHSNKLIEILVELQKSRETRIKKIVSKLENLGYPIHMEDIKKLHLGNNLGRLHVALALINKGIVKNIEEAFEKYLSLNKPAFVERYKLSPFEAIRVIEDSGGVPVLAHPSMSCSMETIEILVNKGIKGIEAFHPKHTKDEQNYYFEYAKKYNLIVTGGSDFHGHEKKDYLNLGKMNVPKITIELLRNSRNCRV
ncbi:MAG: PHP domain-containing protein [Clostridia bacterium]|nr:PHP domain-containing protein [Clostridia bacterium]MDD4047630.1 PHP domain-containing protein [Clostridia bacterium]